MSVDINYYRFFVTHNSVTREVFPLNFIDCLIKYEKDSDQKFYRRKFSGSLAFTNIPSKSIDDFEYFMGIESGIDRCLQISLEIKRSCDRGITYEDNWFNGYFTSNSIEWDLDKCIAILKDINTDDEYRCLLDNFEREVNILQIGNYKNTTAHIIPDYEFYVCRDISLNCSSSLPTPNVWLIFHQEQIDGIDTTIYYRESVVTSCLAGNPQAPSGIGWVQDTSYGACLNGLAKFVRTPTVVVSNNPNPDVAPGDCIGIISDIPPRTKSFDVTKTTTPDSEEIQGYYYAISSSVAGISEWTYEVPNNPNSTYLWGFTSLGGPGFNVISGQGTNKIKGSFTGTTTGDILIKVDETHGNLSTSTKTFSVNLPDSLTNPTGVTNSDIISGPLNVCKNQTTIFYSIPDMPITVDPDITITGPTWAILSGDATIVAGQGTNTVEIDAGNNNFSLNVFWSADNGTNALVKGDDTINVIVSNAARTPDIEGISQVYPNEPNIPYSIKTRPGATYVWSVNGGSIDSGQGTGSVVVDWNNSLGSGSVSVKETINCGCTFIQIAECGTSGEPSFFWCAEDSSTTIEYPNLRTLQDIMQLFIDESGCTYTEAASDFFEINPVGDTTGYIPGINYVTNQSNQVANILVAQKSDVIDPSASNKATKGIITFKQFADWMREIFNVFWFIKNNKVRFEHESYFVRNLGIDITIPPYDRLVSGTRKYSYDKDKMPKYERFKWMEAQDTDFIGAEIRYDSPCVNQDEKNNVKNHVPGEITTDIIYINNSPNEISRNGFVVFANNNAGGVYSVAVESGAITGNVKPNAHLSWANLHYNYHRHGRVLYQGYMNNNITNFISVVKTKNQIDLIIPYCCDDNFDPLSEYILSSLGQGEVETMDYAIKSSTMKIFLKYAV